MIPNIRTLVIAIAVLVVIIVGGILAGGRFVNRHKEDAIAWQTKAEALEPQLAAAIARGDEAIARLSSTEILLDTSLANSRRQSLELVRLRRARADVPLVSSIPGQAPTVGDTLAQCREQLAICAEEAKIAGERGDSLEKDLFEAKFQLGSARESVHSFRSALHAAQAMIEDARPIIRNADPPCYLWKAGPVRVHCLGRKDGAALAAAGTLLVTSRYAKSDDVRRMQQYVAGGLVLGSVVIW